MCDEEDRCLCLARELDQKVLHAHTRGRVERAERLIHENDAWVQDERARDRDALPHAARQLMRILLGIALDIKTNFDDPLSRLGAALVTRHTAAFQPERHVFFDRAVVERSVILKDHTAIGARAEYGFVVYTDRASRCGMVRRQARDQSQKRRLARSRRPQDCHELHAVRQVVHGEGDVADRSVAVIEGLTDLVEDDDWGPRNYSQRSRDWRR